ncbi:MAG: hypothetical protein ABR595_10285 [Psychroflexus sp.]
MNKKIFFLLSLLALLFVGFVLNSESFEVQNTSQSNESIAEVENIPKHFENCEFDGIKLHGKVQFVNNFPDIKIQYVEHFPDIKVKFVENFPNDCGEWQEVENFPDFKVQVVEQFPDLKVKKVEHFPGME